ncbi:2-dehydropantoate 2-reductase (Ketopantoate reductase) (KPA reductase) (KPR) [Ceratobasidium sp. 395]|nr:2-dehydropantoate 2-reductase (Ketopantoate reductase) (KPA reductase) (KPR) [Ceratobasidium sp. 395]
MADVETIGLLGRATLENSEVTSPSLAPTPKLTRRSAMHIHVLGVGSIGSLLALHLRQSTHHPITLFVKRKPFAQTFRNELQHTITIEHNGIPVRADDFSIEFTDPAADSMLGLLRRPDGQLRSKFLRPRSQSFPPASLPSPASKGDPISSLIVTTKAPSVLKALRVLAPRLSSHSTITLLQNGMGVYEELCAKLFPAPASRPHFILGTTTHGAWSKAPFHVVHAARGDLAFGIVPSTRVQLPLETIVSKETDVEKKYGPWLERLTPYDSLYKTTRTLLALSGLSPQWIGAGELQERIQRKLVTNSVVNPLTALMGCRNGALASSFYAKRITQQVCDEAEQVFRAQIADDAGEREEIPFPLRLTKESLEAEVVRVARLTAPNWSSMLQDVRKGHETEVEYMNGYLSRMGERYGVPTPCNDMLRMLVKMKAQMPSGEEM